MDEISAGLAAFGLDARPDPHRAVRARAGARRPGSPRRRRGRRTRPPARPATARRSSSPAATSPSRGASDYASLLELAEACDVPVRWSCRTGVCHNCETDAHRRRRRLRARPGRAPRRRQHADLLLPAARRRRARPVRPVLCPSPPRAMEQDRLAVDRGGAQAPQRLELPRRVGRPEAFGEVEALLEQRSHEDLLTRDPLEI